MTPQDINAIHQTAFCPKHEVEVFPRISAKTGKPYWICRAEFGKDHFLQDPNYDPEGDWGARNNFINDKPERKQDEPDEPQLTEE